MSHTNLLKRLLDAIESGDINGIAGCYADHAVQEEYPNRLLPNGVIRDKAQLLEAAARGLKLMQSQRYTLLSVIEAGDRLAFEAEWEGTLAIDVPPLSLRAGDVMRARFAQFLDIEDGKIRRHTTYDCFYPFAA